VSKRAVLEFVAVSCRTSPADSITDVRLQIPRMNNGVSQTIPIPLAVSRQGDPASGHQRWVGEGPVKLYADNSPAFHIAFGFSRSSAALAATCTVYISGFTIDVP
jgi:hypothetical protein